MTKRTRRALLDQVDSPVASFTADGAYDQDGVYGEVVSRYPRGVRQRATSLERGAKRHRADRADDARSTPAGHRRARPHGLAEGFWLQLAGSG